MRVKYYKDNLNQDRMKKDEILRTLRNEDTKLSILSTLTQINDPEIIQEIIRLFDDDKIEVRGEVFSTLFMNQNNILKELLCGLEYESKNVRAYTILVLANRNEKDATEEIKKMTNDSSGLVRTCAYGALGHLEVKEGAKELHEGIFDSNIDAIKSAVYALSRIGEKISQNEIVELHRFDDPEFNKILKFFN
jgi:HEAT repeat protein